MNSTFIYPICRAIVCIENMVNPYMMICIVKYRISETSGGKTPKIMTYLLFFRQGIKKSITQNQIRLPYFSH